MQTSTFTTTQHKRSKGFSLIEVIIAMGIISLLLSGFLGLFGTAQKSIQRSLSIKESNQIKEALETEMAVLRPKEAGAGGDYANSFHKAFEMIKTSDTSSSAILIYQYKAKPEDDNKDGILPPFTEKNGIPGKDYSTQVAVRKLGAKIDGAGVLTVIKEELNPSAVVGAIYAVRMTQLVKSADGSLIVGTAGSIKNPIGSTQLTANSHTEFTDAVILFQAEFFRLPTNAYGYIDNSGWTFEKLGNPVSVINMAVRR